METKQFERQLTAVEIYDRRLQVESLLDVRDELARKVNEHKFEVKKLQTADSAADAQVRHLRWEIRTGRTYEPQPDLPGINGADDEPDEDTDPPPPRVKVFELNYPAATVHVDLWEALRKALTQAEYDLIDQGVIAQLDRRSPDFRAIAHWARVENAHKTHGTRAPTPGMTVPARFSMPGALARSMTQAAPVEKPAKKRAARRRSGSTQHSD